ncbi:hypothetical protein L202_05143 [Cryptococcus amylolentus CBS 6039]|uniref:Zn(2)-C6 fungal-type domain-containing protein n=1 Tax=Cryptococcus amylolentus CBS 6039 TaxID=1295533 RepID=A0A1E3HNX2_9TREE|nr:hypothetical protein L202_05143 [Cryptococcus amylolentus CBS 6039]ODN78063.1 hypothetical protein L202_05143 [Cryptococcus amylolentus CBS 6039]
MAPPTANQPPDTDTQGIADSAPAGKKTKTTRSRNGCLVCRSRRVKCDVGKPECARCIKYGAECVYPEKKPFDSTKVAEKLRKRHRSDPPGSAGPSNSSISISPQDRTDEPTRPSINPINDHSSASINAFYRSSGSGNTPLAKVRALDPFELLMALCRDTRMGQFFSGPVDPPDFLKEAFPVADDLRCFHHCFTYTLSIFVTHEDYNPFIDHVIPLLLFASGETPLSTGALRNAILATGAVHLASLEEKGSSPDTSGYTRDLGFKYRDEAVKLLRMAQHVPAELQSDSFIAATGTLTGADLLGAHPRWREPVRLSHLAVRSRGGMEVLLFGPRGTHRPTPLKVCLVEYMVLTDMFAALTTNQPWVVITETATWWEKLHSDDPSIPDTFEQCIGLHRGIVRLLSRTHSLISESSQFAHHIALSPAAPFSFPFLPTSRPDLRPRIFQLCADLDAWRVGVLPGIGDKRTHDGSLAMWHAVGIMVERGLLGRGREDEGVQRHAVEVMDICVGVGPKIEFMNWPFLIASSVFYRDLERDRARDVIKAFVYQCSYELDILGTVSEECWRRIDAGMDEEACSWQEILMEMGYAVILG